MSDLPQNAILAGPESASEFRAGWPTFLGCLLCVVLGPALVGFYSFSLVLESLAREFGWSRTALSFAITVGTVGTAFAAPAIGTLIDRQGVRRVMIPATITLGVLMAALSQLGSAIIALYGGFLIVGILADAVYIGASRAVAAWFDRRRGLALGMVMSGTGIGTVVVLPYAQYFSGTYDWRAMYLALGGLILAVAVPAAVFLVRDRDRAAAPGATPPAAGRVRLVDRNLVLLSFAYLFIGIGLDGVLIHFPAILTSRGETAAAAAAIFSFSGTTIILARIGGGFLMDRAPARLIGAAMLSISAVGVLLLALASGQQNFYVASALFGIGVGAEMDVLGYLVSRLYPADRFARAYGVGYSAFMIGTSLGPTILGAMYDASGNYILAIYICATLVLAAGAIFTLIRGGSVPAKI